MSDQSQPQSGIELESSFFVLAFILYFFLPKVVVNGYDPGKVSWGRIFIPLPPGRHTIRVFFPYLFISGGDVTGTVDVHEGYVTSLTYRAPLLVFMAGRLTVGESFPIGSRPMAPIPPVWGSPPIQPAQQYAVPTAAPVAAVAPQSESVPAGWHPDPMARHEMRYWDGQSWTSHVSDQGVQSADEVG